MKAWEIYLHGELIEIVYFNRDMDEDQVRRSLVDHDGFSPEITLR